MVSKGTYKCGGDAYALGGRKRRAEVVPLVARGQWVVWHARGQVGVQQGAQGQTIVPGGAKQQTNGVIIFKMPSYGPSSNIGRNTWRKFSIWVLFTVCMKGTIYISLHELWPKPANSQKNVKDVKDAEYYKLFTWS